MRLFFQHVDTTVRDASASVAGVKPPSLVEGVALIGEIGDIINVTKWVFGRRVRHALWTTYFIGDVKNAGWSWAIWLAMRSAIGTPSNIGAIIDANCVIAHGGFSPVSARCNNTIGLEIRILCNNVKVTVFNMAFGGSLNAVNDGIKVSW